MIYSACQVAYVKEWMVRCWKDGQIFVRPLHQGNYLASYAR